MKKSDFQTTDCKAAKVLVLPKSHQTASVERLADKIDIYALRAQSTALVASIDLQLVVLEEKLTQMIRQSFSDASKCEELIGTIARCADTIRKTSRTF
jgi:vacuolar-type H+-ATPase subunit I/STV1